VGADWAVLKRHIARQQSRLGPGNGSPLLPAFTALQRRSAAAGSAPTDSGSAVAPSKQFTMPLFFVPMIGLENRRHEVTLGLQAQAMLTSLLMPVMVAVAPSLDWHCSRDVYCGFSPVIQVALSTFIGSEPLYIASFPLWVQWQRMGYINEDIDYNLSDVTALTATVAPQALPLRLIKGNDTTTAMGGMFMAGIQFRHGFPLGRYSALSLVSEDLLQVFSEKTDDPQGYVDGFSDLYAQLSGGLEYTFPIVRNINRGRLYADNLYGTVFYNCITYGNREGLAGLSERQLFDPPQGRETVMVAHIVGAGLDFGFIKKYTFNRRLALKAGWDLAGRNSFVNFAVGM
jgi:hypothetical protein